MTFSPRNIAQSSEITHNYEKELKGIEKVEWTPNGQFLTVIGFNEVVSNGIALFFYVLFVTCFFIFTIS